MCQQIIQFCTGSTRPLLFAGSFLTLVLAVAIGWTACTTQALYQTIDATVAADKSLAYHLQLAASGYLVLVTVLGCYAAYYDQKHSIRALAVITSLNFVLALAAIALVPGNTDVKLLFENRLSQAAGKYDFAENWPPPPPQDQNATVFTPAEQMQQQLSQSTSLSGNVQNSTSSGPIKRSVAANKAELSPQEATRLWDSLQSRGCCGVVNGTETWKRIIPKSCCARNDSSETNGEFKCKAIDDYHKQGCLDLVGTTGVNLLIVLALIALVNFYMANITGINAYRTFHYNEASQGPYS